MANKMIKKGIYDLLKISFTTQNLLGMKLGPAL